MFYHLEVAFMNLSYGQQFYVDTTISESPILKMPTLKLQLQALRDGLGILWIVIVVLNVMVLV